MKRAVACMRSGGGSQVDSVILLFPFLLEQSSHRRPTGPLGAFIVEGGGWSAGDVETMNVLFWAFIV